MYDVVHALLGGVQKMYVRMYVRMLICMHGFMYVRYLLKPVTPRPQPQWIDPDFSFDPKGPKWPRGCALEAGQPDIFVGTFVSVLAYVYIGWHYK